MLQIIYVMLASMAMLGSNGSISGSVVDPAEWPLAGARVQLLDAIKQTVVSEVITNSRGNFSFEKVKPGGYFVNITARGFIERTASAYVEDGQSVHIGNQPLFVAPAVHEVGVQTLDGKILHGKLDAGYSHLRHIKGRPIGTVCEYLKVKSRAGHYLYYTSVVVIGILKKTAEGSWLQQSCGDSLKSGDFVWPNAIALKEWGDAAGGWSISSLEWKNDYAKQLVHPSGVEIAPDDQNGPWVAVYGILDLRDQLVVTPCGEGRICANGYGPISAPMQITFQHIHYLINSKIIDRQNN